MSATRKGLTPDDLLRLREAMESGEIDSLEEIRSWIERECGISYTARGVAKLVERELGAKRVWGFHRKDHGGVPEQTLRTDAIIDFVNGLRVTGMLSDDTLNLKTELTALLEGVDRVSVYIGASQFDQNHLYQTIIVDNNVSIDEAKRSRKEELGAKRSIKQQILEHLRVHQPIVENYHEPVVIEYFSGTNNYLGSIWLWREISKPLETMSTDIALLNRLTPLIQNHVLHMHTEYDRLNPSNSLFHESINLMTTATTMSPRELQVITFRLLGFSYEEIAKKLSLSKSTIHKHIMSAHRKTETSSIGELFGKYFTPRLNMDADAAP